MIIIVVYVYVAGHRSDIYIDTHRITDLCSGIGSTEDLEIMVYINIAKVGYIISKHIPRYYRHQCSVCGTCKCHRPCECNYYLAADPCCTI